MAKQIMVEPEESILTVDQTQLDREWIEQPRLFFRYAKELADARQAYEEAKANLKLVMADADRKIRLAKQEPDGPKITEASINAKIMRRDDYQAADKKILSTKHRVDVLDAAVTALEHRKAALENLVKLHGQNYFSTPKADSDNIDRVTDMRMKRNAGRKVKVG